jgi:histidinol dehydrogenase
VTPPLFARRDLAALLARQAADDPETEAQAGSILDAVRTEGLPALRRLAEAFGDRQPDEPLFLERDALLAARDALPAEPRALLERTAARIEAFAVAQRQALPDVDVPVPGGRAGHTVRPVARAGCYAPGGRFPLPSSVLMTAVTARAAGVEQVVVASPRPGLVTLAAAAIAGADRVLAVGGAQAIAALAYGVDGLDRVDAIVGPGNRWVTAAKRKVSGDVRIDLLAGPSELVVLADGHADPTLIAADLLAQAEHDPDAVPILITPSEALAARVADALAAQLLDLPTAAIARQALANGGAVVVGDLDAAIAASNALAPEHLQVMTDDAPTVARRCQRYGGLFVGAGSAEVLGDYGVGPNHTLPTGGTGRFQGGLSVASFLVTRTWLRMDGGDDARAVAADAVALARLEGLEAHARAAARRA